MLMTELGAREKRCTYALVLMLMDSEQLHGRQAAGDNVVTTCIGPKCMQWRWYKPVTGGAYGPTPEGARSNAPRGYCGLAGFIS
jgi:hypothetical protein